MRVLSFKASFLLIFACQFGQAQEQGIIKPGQLYQSGAVVQSPRYGITSTIPNDWEGLLPRDAEIFLLMPVKSVVGEIYVWATANDSPEKMENRWKQGLDMGGGIVVKAKEEVQRRGEVLVSEAIAAGASASKNQKLYAEGKCGAYGICVVYVLRGEAATFEEAKKDLQRFVDATVLSEPKDISPYENFNWKQFLEGHALISLDVRENEKSTNEVHFCKDGTFYSKIRRKGLLKDESKAYQGNKEGTWSVNEGKEAVLTLEFSKAPAITIDLFIDQEKVFANGQRYFVGFSDRCASR